MHALTNALKIINAFFANIVPIGDILWTFPQNFSWYANIPIIGSIPFAIYLLLGMGIYFSIRTKFVQFRYFKRGIQVLTKKKKDTTGVSPLAAFMLSAAMRVGPGNIIGVTGAISLGGPGAMFWMWISALLGMASSFVEATLAQIFKEKDGDERLPQLGDVRGLRRHIGHADHGLLGLPGGQVHRFDRDGGARHKAFLRKQAAQSGHTAVAALLLELADDGLGQIVPPQPALDRRSIGTEYQLPIRLGDQNKGVGDVGHIGNI